MPLIQTRTRAFGSPGKYIQGPGELNNIEQYTARYGNKIAVLIDSFFYESLTKTLHELYNSTEATLNTICFKGECSENEINRVKELSDEINPDVVIGIGGGKTLDTVKAVADIFKVPVIVVPTSASTDAPTSALSIVYTDEGEHSHVNAYNKNPDIVLMDTKIISKAPVRLLVSGMGDALATYFEANANDTSDTANYIGDGYRRTKVGMAIAKLCYETLLEKGMQAKIAAEAGVCTEALEDIIETNTLLSGLGFENTGCSAAHGIHNGLTVLPETRKYYHGEKVAFGTICQLILENQPKAIIEDVIEFCISVGLPVTLEELGIMEVSHEKIMAVTKETVKDDLIHAEPYTIHESMVYNAILAADTMGKMYTAKLKYKLPL